MFANSLLEVMQFVFNHTTFDPQDDLDRQLLAAYQPLGIAPGQRFDTARVAQIDGARFRQVVERLVPVEMARSTDPAFKESQFGLFRPKGQMPLELLLFQSIIGPIGLPAVEAMYPAIATTDGKPMNALIDYVNQPQVWKETYKYLFLSEYLTFRLVGQFVDSVSSQVGYVALGSGGTSDPATTALPLELLEAVRKAVTATTSSTSKAIRFTATFGSTDSFITGAAKNISNIGLYATNTGSNLFAANTYNSSSCASNQQVNVSYDITFT